MLARLLARPLARRRALAAPLSSSSSSSSSSSAAPRITALNLLNLAPKPLPGDEEDASASTVDLPFGTLPDPAVPSFEHLKTRMKPSLGRGMDDGDIGPALMSLPMDGMGRRRSRASARAERRNEAADLLRMFSLGIDSVDKANEDRAAVLDAIEKSDAPEVQKLITLLGTDVITAQEFVERVAEVTGLPVPDIGKEFALDAEEDAKKDTDTVSSEGFAIGRRKRASADVWVRPGQGIFVVNGKRHVDYFLTPAERVQFWAPFHAIGVFNEHDVACRVRGGGKVAQAQAVRLGLSRALGKMNPEWRTTLKKAGFLTRDPRVKERKKPGRVKARKSAQWVKR